MLETITGLVSALRQTSPVIFLGLCIASGIIIFIGDQYASMLGLSTFREHYREYIGATFVISLSIVIAQVIWGSGKHITSIFKDYWESKRTKKLIAMRKKQLHKLTPDEKAYLEPYIFNEENTQYFLIEDGIAGGLIGKGIIYRSSNIGSMLDGWAHNIHPWAREYLNEHPELLEGANPNPRRPRNW